MEVIRKLRETMLGAAEAMRRVGAAFARLVEVCGAAGRRRPWLRPVAVQRRRGGVHEALYVRRARGPSALRLHRRRT